MYKNTRVNHQKVAPRWFLVVTETSEGSQPGE